MSYEEMWYLLKKTIKEDCKIVSNISRDDMYKGVSSEAEDILRRMDELEEQRLEEFD